MFTIANEFERYPDGQYRYEPTDVEWARGVAARIRELDQVHPIGCQIIHEQGRKEELGSLQYNKKAGVHPAFLTHVLHLRTLALTKMDP
jgi:hypothetical protein